MPEWTAGIQPGNRVASHFCSVYFFYETHHINDVGWIMPLLASK